jgi:citrate synthase
MQPLEHHQENIGLRGIEVATTKISKIDGEKGKLIYRGFSIEDLAAESTFEEVAFLLIYGSMPTKDQLQEFSSFLVKERYLPEGIISFLHTVPKRMPSMAVLEAGVVLLSGYCPDLQDESIEANYRKGGRIISRIPALIGAWDRIRNGWEPVRPDPDLSHAANYLYMLRGEKPDPAVARVFDVSLILQAEHSFNASTFTARVVASTGSNLYASISAAIGALSGDVHGGASTEVMRHLIEIGDASRVDEWVVEQFDQQKRIMGMGHGVYRTMDPRARILAGMAEMIATNHGKSKWFEMSKKMGEAARQEYMNRTGKEIYPNVDLYTASLNYNLGIPIDLFTPVLASARTAGWVAHILEERYPEPPVRPVLYRPAASYTGEYCGEKGCTYLPIASRR